MRKRKAETDAAPLAKRIRRKEFHREPRIASFDWLQKLNNACVGGLGVGLEKWQPQDPDRAWLDELRPQEELPGALVVLMDQEAKQWCGAHFLKYKLRHCSEFLIGPQHRRANDMDRALNRAGVFGVCLLHLVLNNLPYGSWQGSKNYKDMIDVALEVEIVADPDCPLLMRFWPGICADNHWTAPSQQDRQARKQFLESFSLRRPFEAKGMKASTSRWFSIYQGMRLKDSDFHTFLYAAVTLCVQQGWSESWEDFFDGAIPKAETVAAAKALSSSSSAPQASPKPAAKPKAKQSASGSKAQSKVASRSDLNKMYKKSVNMMHAATRLMAQPEVLHHGRLILLAARPLEREHQASTAGLRSSDECIEWFASMAEGAWLDPMKETVLALKDLDALSRAGFTTAFTTSMRGDMKLAEDLVLTEDRLASTLWRIVLCILSERCSSMTRYVGSYPYKWAAALSRSSSASAMQACKADWDAMTAANEVKLPAVQDLLRFSSIHGRVNEDTFRLARSEGWQASPRVVERLSSIFGCWANEKLAEDALKSIREAEQRDSSSKEIRQWRVWERLVGQQVLSTYKREEVETNVALPIGEPGNVDSMFGLSTVAQPNLDLKRILGKQDWHSWGSDHLKQQAIDSSLMKYLSSSGSWEFINDVWRSAVIPPLQIVLHRPAQGQHSIFLCLHSCPTGVLTWPVVRVGSDHITLDTDISSLEIKHFGAFSDLFVIPANPISPLHAFLAECPYHRLGVMVEYAKPVSLLDWQATRGFPGVTEPLLKKLAEEWGCEAPELQEDDPDFETMLALNIITELCPDLPENEVTAALASRRAHESSMYDHILEAMSTDDIADVASISDMKRIKEYSKSSGDVKSAHASVMSKVVAAVRRRFAARGSVAPCASPAALAAKKAKLSTPAGRTRWWASVAGDIDFVRKWSPPGARTVHDEKNGRFLLHYRDFDRRPVSWTKRGVK